MRVLLLGAGFSRNWGGWLADELVGELCGRLRHIDRRHLVNSLMQTGSFEQIFGERREVAMRESANEQAAEDVRQMDAAIRDTFRKMNLAFVGRKTMEFCRDDAKSVRRFMGQFDAIFTLNQDLLLEFLYPGAEVIWQNTKFTDFCFPGIAYRSGWTAATDDDRLDRQWVAEVVEPPAGAQPIYKLHGSVNWIDDEGRGLMVVGTAKDRDIAGSVVLHRYHEKFQECLGAGGTKMMVIGYGFADPHINVALAEAAESSGLWMYLVNPNGLRIYDNKPYDVRLKQIPLLGLSSRPLSETFGPKDCPSFDSFWRFLD